ncbi:MAG: TetR/AcrR family transcriptional regulator [Pseudomonadota bacterium]
MGYSKEHIAETRRLILDEAGRLMRKHGYGGVSVAKIMSAAGLTHGGFYAHFKSKEELFDAILREDFDFTNQLRRLSALAPSEGTSAAVAARYYLDPNNADKVAPACTLASSSQDVARGRRKTRAAFTKSFRALLEEFEQGMGEPTKNAERRPDALAALATCVGGLVIARALSDKPLVEELLRACQDSVADTLST